MRLRSFVMLGKRLDPVNAEGRNIGLAEIVGEEDDDIRFGPIRRLARGVFLTSGLIYADQAAATNIGRPALMFSNTLTIVF